MAKFKGKGVVIAGLVAGAASYLSKKENRDKAMEYLNSAKEKASKNETVKGLVDKATSKLESKKVEDVQTEHNLEDVASTAGHSSNQVIEGNKMIDEGGGQEVIDKFNRRQDS